MREAGTSSVYMSGSMVPTEQGGCMLVMHSGVPMYASASGSKTEHIMSRYRPIAPKPVAKPQPESDDHSISSLSADNSTTRSSTADYRSTSGPKRSSRKRPTSTEVVGGKKGRKTTTPRSLAEGNFKLTPIFSDRVAPGFGPGGLQRFKDSCEAGVSVSLSLEPGGSNVHSTLCCEEDRGFMERAAANKAFLGYSTAESEVCESRVLLSADQKPQQSFFGCPSASTSSEVCSVEEAAESKKGDLVTLSLLPDAPSFVNTRTTTAAPPLLRSDIRWAPSGDLNTSLTMSRWSDEEAAAPEPDAGEQVVDAQYLEQRHGGSSEAVMLTDELDRVLWVNSAFKRLNNERMSSRMQAIGPHIDPLGIRTHLATLAFQPPFPAFKCKALLWGFLKKFIMQEGGAHTSNLPEVPSPPAKVIAPQPLRAVGSTITVQSIVTADPHAAPVTDGFESVQESLDKGEMPSVITDLKFRVRWVNAAYKRLVGQPKCSWLEEDSQARLAGDVSLVCDATQLPVDIAAFSCRVRIQWSHQGDPSAMSVPSEVVRLDDGSAGSLYVWGFDV